MALFDVLLLLILFGFVFYGFFSGLIRTLGTFFGIFIGALLASRLYLPVFSYIAPLFFGRSNLGKVVVFILLFTIINHLVGFAFYLIDKAFHIIAIIPFLKTINRLAGAILGLITGVLFLGLCLYVISKYSIISSLFGQALTTSQLAPGLIKYSSLLLPLLPRY